MLFLNAEGEEFEVEEKDQAAARQEGLTRAFTFLDDNGQDVVVREQDLNAARESGLKPLEEEGREVGKLEAAGRGLASSLSFGFSDEIGGAIQAGRAKLGGEQGDFGEIYARERDLQRLRNEEAFDQQTGSYGAGFVGGMVTSPLSMIGRGAAKLATKGVSSLRGTPTLGAMAARGAAEGAVAGAGGGAGLGAQSDVVAQEGAQDDVGVSNLAQSTAIGAGAGGALGGVLGKAAQKIKSPAREAVSEAKENAILKSAGYHTSKPQVMLKKAGIDPSDFAADLERRGVFEGVKNTSQVRQNINQLAKKDSEAIGKTIKEIDSVTKQSAQPGSFLESVMAYRQGVQKRLLGDDTAAMDRGDAEALVKKFTSGVDKKFLGGQTPQQLQELQRTDPARYSQIVKRIENKGFQDLYQEKAAISRAIRDLRGQSNAAKAEKAADIQRVLMETVENHVKRNAPDEATAQELIKRLSQNRRDMLFSRTAQNVAKESVDREGKNRALSLTDFVAGGSVASGLGSAVGPAGIPIGFALGAGAARFGRTKGTGALVNPLRGAEEAIDSGAFERAAQKLTRGTAIAGGAAAGRPDSEED